MLPVGLNPSSLAYIFTLGFGHRRLIRTIGVDPIVSSIEFLIPIPSFYDYTLGEFCAKVAQAVTFFHQIDAFFSTP
jgi:hypothetical protein